VLVWQITSEDEVALDRYEGWLYLYRKETMKVRLDKKQVDAMVYILNEGKPINQPSCYYYSTILEGYHSAGFDVEYLRRVVEDSYEKNDAALGNRYSKEKS